MKRYLLSLMVLCSVLSAMATPFTSNEVPADFTNDIMLNADFVELRTGDTYQITARRLPEIVECDFCDSIVLPKFTYKVIEGESVTINADGKITAVKTGRSLIEVGYEATNAFGKDYPAISPVNMAYMVVEVADAESDITISTDIKATSYDTYYYTTNTGFDLTFNVTAQNATTVKVLLNSTELKANTDKSYTAHLTNRTNVIEIEASNDNGTRRWAKTIDARRCEMTVANITNPGTAITAGDSIEVSFRGIVMPVYKLLRFYNPTMEGWGEEVTKAVYQNTQLDSVKSNVEVNQYTLATNNTIGMRLTEDGEHIFNDGYIKTSWWGRAIGDEKNFINGTYPETPGLAETQHAALSKLPAFRIIVKPAIEIDDETEELITLNAGQLMADNSKLLFDSNAVWTKTYDDSVAYRFISDDNFSIAHMPSKNSWGGTSWDGFTVSRSLDSNFETASMARQWGNSASGGIDSTNAPYLLGYFSWYFEYAVPEADKDSLATHALQINLKGKPQQLLGTYINTTAWTTSNVINGSFVRRFTAGDSLILTVHGLDSTGNDNGRSIAFPVADFRDDQPENWYMPQNWEWLDLTALGTVSGIYFTMESSDQSDFGPNTATYIALDQLSYIAKKETEASTDRITDTTLAIYPNPVRDIAHISAPDGITATIYNLHGQAITSATVIDGQINLSHLTAGIYIIRIDNTTARIIKL